MNFKTIILIALMILIGSIIKGQISDNVGDNTRFGDGAGLNITNVNNGFKVSIFGRSAGLKNTGEFNSFFGFNAGRNAMGTNNSFFGHRTGLDNTTGTDNSFFGSEAGNQNKTGSNNSFFGRRAGQFSTSDNNSFFGHSAGDSTTSGWGNTFIGSGAGKSNTMGSGNSFFGGSAGNGNTKGFRNAFFGSLAGSNNSTGHNNVAIGYNAGPPDGTSDVDSTLYIDVMATSSPLLYGHFGRRVIAINGDFIVDGTTKLYGDFEVNGALFGGSSKYIKQDFIPVDPKLILEKVSALPISTWAYIDKPEVRHMGPMAQDFHAAFGLGKDDVTIATVDADGLALASIQALYSQLEEEKKVNREQNDLIQSLITRLEKLENK